MRHKFRLSLVIAVVTVAIVGVAVAFAWPNASVGNDVDEAPSPPPALSSASAQNRCTGTSQTGRWSVNVTSEGQSYSVPMFFPSQYDGHTALPMVLSLHGSGGNGLQQLAMSQLQGTANLEGFVVAAPNGGLKYSARSYSWNVPEVPSGGFKKPTSTRDDISFLKALITQLTATLCVDPKRVFVMGFSGGARMASALACNAADLIAGFSAVSGLRAGIPDPKDPKKPEAASCLPSRAVPVIAFHGQQDKTNPYDGNGDKYWKYSVPDALATWSRLDGCTVTAATAKISKLVTLTEFANCSSQSTVELYTIANGGHTWPGSAYPQDPVRGEVNKDISANLLSWKFFTSIVSQ